MQTVKETVYKVHKLVMEENVWRQLSPAFKIYIEDEKFDSGVTKEVFKVRFYVHTAGPLSKLYWSYLFF